MPTKMSPSEIEKKLAQKIHETHILSFLMTNLIFQKGEFKWLIGLEQITFRMPDLLNTIELESLYSGQLFSLEEQIRIILSLSTIRGSRSFSRE